MAIERLLIQIDGKATGAINAAKQTETAISKLGNVIKGIAIGGGALILAQKGFQMLENSIKGTIAFMNNATKEAGYAELQLIKLNTSLKSTGNFTQEVSDELVKYAESLQEVTAYEDDAVVAVEAMLATFKLSKDEIKIATQATLDLAAATGQDLQSAAILMGKAMVGETGMLKRYGIIVDENKLKTQGWRAVIDEINVEFGGQALAQGQTYTGMLERMGNVAGDLKETIGGVLLPTIKNLITGFIEGGDVANEFGSNISNAQSPLQKIQEFVAKAAEKIKIFLDALIRADWTKVIDGFNQVASSIGILISGHSSVETLDQKVQHFVDTLGELLFKISQIIAAFKLIFDTVLIVVRGIENIIFQIIVFNEKITGMGIASKFGADQLDIFNKSVKKSEEFNILFSQAIQNADDDLAKITASYQRGIEFSDSLREATRDMIPGFALVAEAANKSTGAFEQAIPIVEELADAKEKLKKATDGLYGSLFDEWLLNADISEGLKSAQEKYDEYTKAVDAHGIKSDEAREKEEEWIRVIDGLTSTQIPELINKTGLLTQEEIKNLLGMQGQIDKAHELGIVSDEEWKKISASITTAVSMSIVPGFARAAEAARKYASGLNNIPRNISTTITTRYITEQGYTNLGNIAAHSGGLEKQSGGISRFDSYIPDLNMFTKKGEGIIPDYIVRAIKENRGSFAGINPNSGGSPMNFNINVTGNYISSDYDIDSLTTEMAGQVKIKLAGVGIR